MAAAKAHIRPEVPADAPAVRSVLEAAFLGGCEARLVDLIRERGRAQVSLVAELQGEIVGHILFSEVTIGAARGTGLAPVCVVPAQQKRGIGKALVNAGLEACRKLGLPWCVVLGDPAYYGQFGFVNAARLGIANEYNADEHFMVQELRAGSLPVEGLAKYLPEFGELGV